MRFAKSLLLAAGLMLAAVTASAQTLTPFEFSSPLRFDYISPGPGDKPLLTRDLDGPYIKSITTGGLATVQLTDNTQATVQIAGSGGTSDGVVSAADYSVSSGTLSLTRTVGMALTVNIDEIIFPNASGDLPDPSVNQGRLAVSGNHLLQSIDHGATDKVVGFKAYGPDRVIDTGEPALLQDEVNYQGSFASPPPLANYSVNDFLWDRGSSVWLIRRSGSTTWGTTGGPHGYAPGHLYATEADAARHVTGTGYFAHRRRRDLRAGLGAAALRHRELYGGQLRELAVGPAR